MIVKVNLFAAAKEIVGENTIALEFDDGATVHDLKRALVKQYPAMANLVENSAFSVDKDYAHNEVALYSGAEVGLIPPVSGG